MDDVRFARQRSVLALECSVVAEHAHAHAHANVCVCVCVCVFSSGQEKEEFHLNVMTGSPGRPSVDE